MAEVLYRKYRSRAFAEVLGQEAVVTVLLNSLRNGKFAHAYLLAGPRGTGKTTIARLIAKAVNCENFIAEGDVCNRCASCLAIEAGNHIDVLEIDAASNRGIEEIRQIRDTINFLPSAGKFKVFIIDEAHMLTREAFNALLKTLEEPPAHVMFIMATTEAHKVPVTILSRLQRFDLKLASPEQLNAKLAKILEAEGYKAEKEVYDLLYAYSDGSYRDAESILGKIVSSHTNDSVITVSAVSQLLGMPSAALVRELLGILISGDADAGMQKVAEASEAGSDFAHLVKSMTSTLRQDIVKIVKAGDKYDRELLVLHTLMGLQSEIKVSDDMRLLLEIAVLKLANSANVTSPSAAIAQPAKPKTVAAEATIQVAKIEDVKPMQPKPVQLEKPAKVTDGEAASSPEGQWERMLVQTRKIDFRLFTVLKTCTAVLDGNQLRLLTSYKSNIELLQGEASISKLRPLLDMIYSADTNMEFALIGGDSSVKTDFSERDFMLDSNASMVEEMF